MTARRALVLNNGSVEQLQSGDTLEGVAGIPVISSGDSGKVLAVKSDETGAEWVDAPSGSGSGVGDKLYLYTRITGAL